MNRVTATPRLMAPNPWLVVIFTDNSVPCVTATLLVTVATQFGDVAVLGPVMVAVIPVLTGVENPHGLVNTSALTEVPAGMVLSRIFSTMPTRRIFAAMATVLVVNSDAEDEVPSPTQPPSLTD